MTHQLNEILRVSNRNNEANGITGALVYDNQWFLQVLEGEPAAVWPTVHRIKHDPRHGDVTILDAALAARRHFGAWHMGCAERSAGNAATFGRYLHDGCFQPPRMMSGDMISLLAELAVIGFKRELAA